MKLAPIVMFVYNRVDHFEQTYEALCQCDEAKESELYIFSDGAKTETDVSKVEAVRAAIREKEQNQPFKQVHIVESQENQGLAKSVITGVTQVLETWGKVIVLEDDSVVSPYFLKFMNQCLEYYAPNRSVGSIAGYTPRLKNSEEYTEDVFFAYRSCSCAWATWKGRWENVDWELKEMQDFYRDMQLVQRLNANGSDRFLRLYRQTKGNGSSWSVRFGAHLVKRNMLTVYPKYSYVQNIGCDASGVHSKAEDAEKMEVDLSKALSEVHLMEPSIDTKIQKAMKRHYSGGVLSDIKRAVATKAVVLWNRRNRDSSV